MSFTETRASWQPESYAELGASVPFTTPELTGARARNTGRGLELTLPNPSGRRGIYILDPRELGRFCPATLHDRQLTAAMTSLPSLTPASVREAARQVAASGYAGRAAAAAVNAARDADRKAELAAQLGLVRLLVRQEAGSDAAAADMPARVAISAVAARCGQSFASIKTAIERLAVLMAPIGLSGWTLNGGGLKGGGRHGDASPDGVSGGAQARHPAMLARLDAMLAQAAVWAGQDLGRASMAASLIVSAGRETVALAQRALELAARMLDGLPALLTAMLTNPGASAALMMRLDWLLDGWPMVAMILQHVSAGRICAAVTEAAFWVPIMPVEAGSWFGTAAAGVARNEAARHINRAEVLSSAEWRKGGIVLALVPRNEAFRAMAA